MSTSKRLKAKPNSGSIPRSNSRTAADALRAPLNAKSLGGGALRTPPQGLLVTGALERAASLLMLELWLMSKDALAALFTIASPDGLHGVGRR
jgi:hypothetical protein